MLDMEQASSLRTHIEAVEYFSQRQCYESHRCAVFACGDLPYPRFDIVADEVCCKSKSCKDHALIYHIESHTAGKYTFGRFSRVAFHYVVFRSFNAQGKGREAVGYKVDPKQVYRLQDRESEHRRHKDGYYLTHVGSKQELYGLADIIVNPSSFFHSTD